MNIYNKKSKGSIMDLLSVGITIIAMSIIMMAYLNSIQLVHTKSEVSQLARKYILRMETVGCLTVTDKMKLLQELQDLGITDVDLNGSTMNEVAYGSPIYLYIHGVVHGREMKMGNGLFSIFFSEKGYNFREVRMSTAKN